MFVFPLFIFIVSEIEEEKGKKTSKGRNGAEGIPEGVGVKVERGLFKNREHFEEKRRERGPDEERQGQGGGGARDFLIFFPDGILGHYETRDEKIGRKNN